MAPQTFSFLVGGFSRKSVYHEHTFRVAGNAISVYGMAGPENGPYNVTLDGTRSAYNGSAQTVTPNALLVGHTIAVYMLRLTAYL
jgi:hypothetical protein